MNIYFNDCNALRFFSLRELTIFFNFKGSYSLIFAFLFFRRNLRLGKAVVTVAIVITQTLMIRTTLMTPMTRMILMTPPVVMTIVEGVPMAAVNAEFAIFL